MEKNVVWDRTEWVRRGALVSLALSAGVVLVNCGGTSELRKRRADDGTGAATDAGPGGSGGSSFETGGSHGGGSGGGGSGGDGSVVSVTGGVVGSASGGVGGSGVGGIGGSGVGGIGGSGVGGIGGDGTGGDGTGGIGTGGIGTGGDGTGGTGGDETGGTGGTGGGGTGGTGGGGTGGTGGMDQGESIFLSEGANSLSDAAFFDHPWPSDVRRDGNGFLVLEGYPNPFDNALIATYKTLMAGRLDGFSPAAAGYVRFTVPLDSGTLPATVAASTASNSNVQLIDITPDSPEYGERKPITLSFYANASTYLPENTLAFAPAFGQPLRPYTTYAFVVTESVLDQAGLPLIPGPDLQEYLDGNVPSWAYMYAAAISELAAMNIDDILQLAVFTTPDPTREAFALRDATIEDFESPSVSGYVAEEQVAGVYDVYEGEYGPSPDFQFGTPPFVEPTSGGDVRYDSDGKPIVQREFDLRFALGVPDATECPPPSQGYPIVLVAHGTGGDYRSAFNTNAEATMFAEQCLATLSIDQIFHGTRPGAELDSADLLYFNLQNPLASRTNGPQSAVDFVQLARLVTEGTLKVPASTSRTGKAIKFDPDRVLFFGHSQGGLNGPIALAADDQYRGGVFSGAAATITLALLDKKEPYDFRALLAGLLGLTNAAELDEFHPALSLAQTIADPADGIHYARAIVREPRAGFAAKSLFMTEGVRADGSGDSYAPPRGIESLAAAVGLPVRLPQIHASNFGEWAGLSPLTVPSGGVSGNLAGGAASGVLAQYDADGATDGHFVAYQVVEAREDLAMFLRSLADEPAGRVPE